MDDKMKQKIDTVLERIKEPESGLSIARIGLVQKFRYVPARSILYVFRNPIGPAKGCCTIVSNLLLETTQNRLVTALKAAFPELSIQIVVSGCEKPGT